MHKVSEVNQHLLQRLFDLTSKTSGFFRIDRDAEIADVLEQVAQEGEPGAISGVVNCLFSTSSEVRTAASRTVHSLLDPLAPEQLRHLGDMVTDSSSWSIGFAWERLTPAGVHKLITEGPTRTSVLGLLSFHSNGYVRHEALRLLAQNHDGSELPLSADQAKRLG